MMKKDKIAIVSTHLMFRKIFFAEGGLETLGFRTHTWGNGSCMFDARIIYFVFILTTHF